MALVGDRIKETTVTQGTGNITLAGAVAQFITFNSEFGIGPNFYYALIDGDGINWETGQGYLSNSTTLVRNQIHESTNGGAAINLSANTHSIFSSAVAEMFADFTGKNYCMSRGIMRL